MSSTPRNNPARDAGRGALFLQITASFFRIGLFTFGGGASVIPILKDEVVTRHAWFDEEEFLDIYTLGSTLPGPIGSNLAGYIGFRLAGTAGAVFAITASVLPTAAAMIFLAALYSVYRDNAMVAGFLEGVRPVVIALLALVAVSFIGPSVGRPRDGWQFSAKLALAALMFALTLLTDLNAAVLIGIGGAIGLLVFR